MSENLHTRILRILFRAGTPVATTGKAADELVAEIEDRITSAIRDYADSERAAMVSPDSYLQRFDITAYEQMKHLFADASNIAKYALSERRTDESLQISERGMAVIESGLTLRQAHEIKSDYAAFFCQSGCDCSCCYGMDDCYHVTDPCNCGKAAKDH